MQSAVRCESYPSCIHGKLLHIKRSLGFVNADSGAKGYLTAFLGKKRTPLSSHFRDLWQSCEPFDLDLRNHNKSLVISL